MNGIPAETANTPATAPAEEPKLPKKPRVAAHAANVAPSKARSGHKATPAKKATKGAKSANSSKKKGTGGAHKGKTAQVLELLKRSGGATLKELMRATAWQAHSVRGFLSGALRKKMGLTITSTKAADDERRYSVKG